MLDAYWRWLERQELVDWIDGRWQVGDDDGWLAGGAADLWELWAGGRQLLK